MFEEAAECKGTTWKPEVSAGSAIWQWIKNDLQRQSAALAAAVLVNRAPARLTR